MNVSTISAATAEHYRSEYAAAAHVRPGRGVPWLERARSRALERFLVRGFPTVRDEDWKYTSVAPIEKSRFSLAAPGHPVAAHASHVDALALPGAHVMVFVAGRFAPELSRSGPLPAGATLASMADVLERDPERARGFFEREEAGAAFDAMNAAFATDGAWIELAAGVALDAPVQLLFIAGALHMSQVRNVIAAGAGSRIEVIEHHAAGVDAASASYFTNAVTRIVAADGAQVAHHKLQQESAKAFHVAAVTAEQGADSRFASSSFALGGALVRVGIDADLAAEGAACELTGLYLTDGRQHVDHHTRVDHRKPRGVSRELYKGVLSGLSRAVFNGKVIVHPDAQRSDAQQSNRNLLLSEHAEIDTKPQLEIYADDVKCTHGATVGQLDPEQLFYLRTRGVDEAAGRVLLTYAFAEEVVAKVGIGPLNAHLEQLLLRRLPEKLKELL